MTLLLELRPKERECLKKFIDLKTSFRSDVRSEAVVLWIVMFRYSNSGKPFLPYEVLG